MPWQNESEVGMSMQYSAPGVHSVHGAGTRFK